MTKKENKVVIGKSKTFNENYAAQIIIVKNIGRVPKTDFLKMFKYQGATIISSSIQEGDKVVYFPVESAIDAKFLSKNNLFRDSNLNADKEKKGFFEATGRVKALKLHKVASEGFVIPLEAICETYPDIDLDGLNHVKVGESFDSINGHVILKKYKIRRDQKEEKEANANGKKAKVKKESKLIENQFKLHHSTPKLAINIHTVQSDDVVTITKKLHGTSFVVGNVLTKRKLNWFERLLSKFVKIQTTEYGNIHSSRTKVLNEYFTEIDKTRNPFYGTDEFRTSVNDKLKDNLHKGETVYGEIVGYASGAKMIQKDYDYGCKIGEHKAYIYRITHTNVDGKTIELDYGAIVERCKELDVEHVPILYRGKWLDFLKQNFGKLSEIVKDQSPTSEDYTTLLKELYVYDQNCTICVNKVPDEGICLTTDSLYPKALKLKSSAFLQKESLSLDKGVIDTESDS